MAEMLTKDRLLSLTPDEQTELLSILEQAHLNTRVEQRRGDSLSRRETLTQKEAVLQRLIEKVRHLG